MIVLITGTRQTGSRTMITLVTARGDLGEISLHGTRVELLPEPTA